MHPYLRTLDGKLRLELGSETFTKTLPLLVLTFLALDKQHLSRAAVASLLWPDNEKRQERLSEALRLLRRLSPDLLIEDEGSRRSGRACVAT